MTQASAAAVPSQQSIVNPDGTTNRIWLSSYVKGVPADIDLNKYKSLSHYFDECVNKFRARPGFVSIGTEMSYDRLDRLVKAFAGRKQNAKVLLLDQRIVAGLGNIYVCEALNRARISPFRPAGAIPAAKLAALVPAIKAILAEVDGEIIEAADKVVARRARVVRRLDTWNERTQASSVLSK